MFCKCNKNIDGNDNKFTQNTFGVDIVMECNLSHFIFFLSGDFYMLNYYQCHDIMGETDFRKDILKKICGKIKEQKHIYLNLETGCRLDSSLRNEIKKGQITKLYALEVVYTYGQGLSFCITNKISITDMISYSAYINENYQKAKDYIENTCDYNYRVREYFLDTIQFYKTINTIELSNTEVVSTVDQLIKQINQKTNERVKIS